MGTQGWGGGGGFGCETSYISDGVWYIAPAISAAATTFLYLEDES